MHLYIYIDICLWNPKTIYIYIYVNIHVFTSTSYIRSISETNVFQWSRARASQADAGVAQSWRNVRECIAFAPNKNVEYNLHDSYTRSIWIETILFRTDSQLHVPSCLRCHSRTISNSIARTMSSMFANNICDSTIDRNANNNLRFKRQIWNVEFTKDPNYKQNKLGWTFSVTRTKSFSLRSNAKHDRFYLFHPKAKFMRIQTLKT